MADDNARPHRACVMDAYLHEQNIICIDWAPYRPDMKSIEHIWDEIGPGLEELDPQKPSKMYGNRSLLKESRHWLVACHAESVL